MLNYDDGRDWTTRRLGAVTGAGGGNRLSVRWDPKCGGPLVRIEGDIAEDCDGEEPDEDGYCRDWQAFVLHLSPTQAEELARWLNVGASESRAFFAPVKSDERAVPSPAGAR